MEYRVLGQTRLQVSAIGFGAGPVAGLMTDADAVAAQLATVQAALDAGVNWLDTAPGYGDGASEQQLGRTLAELGARDRVHVATKVRLLPEELGDIPGAVRRSVERSLQRLGGASVTLLQLHNAITAETGAIHLSLTPAEALYVGEALTTLREQGLCAHVGMTAQGDPAAVREVMASGLFATAQVPWNLLEDTRRSTGLDECVAAGVAPIAIRVLAGGALALQPPSAHTRRTPFFPLAQYEADRELAEALRRRLPAGLSLPQAALQYVLHEPRVSLSLVGFASAPQVREAVAALTAGPWIRPDQ
jgi:aryl-alcohol dehydrogenase-like predicted oxidoreductase